jgi:NitT/TauT family transport system substrate-binding protein
VPAVALWVPFDITVKQKTPGARKLVDASAYYPQAAIVGGWAVRGDYYDKNRDVCQRVIRGWTEANDYLIGPNSDKAVEELQKTQYAQIPLAEFREQFKASRYFTSADWRKMYADGTVTKWLQQVTDFFVKFGNIQNPVPASQYFDTKLYLETIKA